MYYVKDRGGEGNRCLYFYGYWQWAYKNGREELRFDSEMDKKAID
jgi:hypothetical protein